MDADVFWGNDISVSATGDVALAGSQRWGEQRVLRRLLTNAGAYLWDGQYGGGLPAFVGATSGSAAIRGVIAAQLKVEQAVAQIPTPVVSIQVTSPATIAASIKYSNAADGMNGTLHFALGG